MKKIKRSKSAGGIVVNDLGQVAVVSQRGKSWSLPKGRRKKGESYEAAARREIGEETGISELRLVVRLGRYVRFGIGKNGSDDRWRMKIITLFLFVTPQRRLRPADPHNPEARWVDPREVVNLLTHPKDQEVFKRWWKKAKQYRR